MLVCQSFLTDTEQVAAQAHAGVRTCRIDRMQDCLSGWLAADAFLLGLLFHLILLEKKSAL